jgi:CubicO group peptidase (beta-lactamase class C family)
MARLFLAALAWLALVPLAAAAPAPPGGYGKAMDTMAASLAAQDRFSGTILVAKDGQPIYRRAFGQANREWGVANTPDTEFRLGSITKQFTAAAILQLAEQGKLSLDDPISKYYAAAPPAWAPITIKHLLTHSSGIPSYTALPGFFSGAMSRTDMKPEEIVALTKDKPLEFTPGARFNYDNTGYVLLGVVIEKVSGQSYAKYLQDHIFGPLGLKHTGYDVSEEILPKRAAGYDKRAGKVTNAPYLAMSLPYAAGSLYSTVDDLLAWDVALRGGKVISPASVTAMFTDYGFKYGYGQFLETREGKRYWQHAGGINGFTTMLARYPDQGLTLVVLTNLTTSDPGHVADTLADVYFHPEHAAGPAGPPTAAELGSYVGRYKYTDALTLDVTREGTRLFAQSTGAAKTEFFREFGRNFFGATNGAGYIQFAPGDKSPEVVVRRGPTRTVLTRAN